LLLVPADPDWPPADVPLEVPALPPEEVPGGVLESLLPHADITAPIPNPSEISLPIFMTLLLVQFERERDREKADAWLSRFANAGQLCPPISPAFAKPSLDHGRLVIS
jgi:hypothetical protein